MESDFNNRKGIKVYILIAKTPAGDQQELIDFTKQLGKDVFPALQEQTGISWEYHIGNIMHLDNTETRRADDFLRNAFLRMVQTSCDVVLVVTDAALVSESQFVVPGLAAPEAQVGVVSTEKLLTVPLGEPVRSLNSAEVRWNAAALWLHLLGHLLKMEHRQKGIMAPFEFNKERRQLPDFSENDKAELKKSAKRLAVRELPSKGMWSSLKIHFKALFERPVEVFSIVWRSRAPLMPFSLTKITTAALTPAFLMFFTDEFWWVGIHRDPVYLWTAAATAILIGTFYIPYAQSLLFPHREKRVITQNVAIANMGMMLTLFFMLISLFILVALVIFIVVLWWYPPGFVEHWFKSFKLEVSWRDMLQIAVVVSTLGTLTGALGSGFHGRKIIRAVSFFLREP